MSVRVECEFKDDYKYDYTVRELCATVEGKAM